MAEVHDVSGRSDFNDRLRCCETAQRQPAPVAESSTDPMPEMDGLMLAEEIRKHRDAESLTLVLLTSRRDIRPRAWTTSSASLTPREGGRGCIIFVYFFTNTAESKKAHNLVA